MPDHWTLGVTVPVESWTHVASNDFRACEYNITLIFVDNNKNENIYYGPQQQLPFLNARQKIALHP